MRLFAALPHLFAAVTARLRTLGGCPLFIARYPLFVGLPTSVDTVDFGRIQGGTPLSLPLLIPRVTGAPR